MSVLTSSLYEKLASDPTLTALLATYSGSPAIFTMDPAPGDAQTPYIVTAGEVTQTPFDTKTTLGRTIVRDIRVYDEDSGNPVTVEAIAERVRVILHRQEVTPDGYDFVMSSVSGPIVADELDSYGRVVTLTVIVQNEEESSPTFLGAFDSGFSLGFE